MRDRIKVLEKEVTKYSGARFVEAKGNANRQYRPFALDKLSSLLNEQELHSRFLQGSGMRRGGKELLKAD